MKKFIILLLLFLKFSAGHSDNYFLPVRYTGFFSSAELAAIYEWTRNPGNTLGASAGFSFVDPLCNKDHPVGIVQLMLEGRQYLESSNFRHFFISGFLSAVYVTDFTRVKNVGIIPGLKINYKSQISNSLVLEPYLGLSLPFICDIENFNPSLPFPALTIGIRFGFSKIMDKLKN